MVEAFALRSIVSGLRLARKQPKRQVEAIRGLLDDGLGATHELAGCVRAGLGRFAALPRDQGDSSILSSSSER
jgi:hypothetical protein